MEIAFFTDPVANTDVKTQAPATCPRQEFSFLLAAMLKSAQPGTAVDSGLLDAGSIPVSEEGEAKASIVDSEGLEETENIIEEETTQLEEPADALASVANIFAPVPFVGPVQNPAVTAMQTAPDAATKAPGNEVAAAAVQKTAFFRIEENEAVAKGIRNIVDSSVMAGTQTGQGEIELSEDLLASSAPIEDFEMEIPAEVILNQAAQEAMNEPALAASGVKAEAGVQVKGSLMEPAHFDFSAKMDDDKGASVDKTLTSASDIVQPPAASFEGFETDGRDASEEEIGQGASFDAQAVKPEAASAGVTFDKAIEHAEKPQATTARMTTVTAEVHEKVEAGMKVSIEQGGGEVKMKLNPDSLGEVRIKLNVNEGMVRAEITVDNPEVKRIIEADSSFLRESLGAQGLTLDKCVVEVGRSFDARYREDSDRSQPDFNEHQRPMRDRDEDKGNNGWHRHFRRHNIRENEGGIDFFA